MIKNYPPYPACNNYLPAYEFQWRKISDKPLVKTDVVMRATDGRVFFGTYNPDDYIKWSFENNDNEILIHITHWMKRVDFVETDADETNSEEPK